MNTTWLDTAPRRDGWLSGLDPRFKLAVLAWVSAWCVLVDSLPALGAAAALGLIGLCGAPVHRRHLVLIAVAILAVAWGTALSQAMFYAGQPRRVLLTLLPGGSWWGIEFGGLHLYREGFAYGGRQSLRLVAVTLTGLAVCLSTGPDRLLAALVRLRVPMAVAFLGVTALRFLPLLAVQWRSLRQARRWRVGSGRGTAVVGRPPLVRDLALLRPLLVGALRRAGTLAASVSGRGFDPAAGRTFYPPLRLSRAEGVVLVALAGVMSAAFLAKGLYWLHAAGRLSLPALQGVYTAAQRWL